MSGKGKITQWGGSRQGAGRKPRYMMSDYMVKKMIQTARKKAKEYGQTLDEVLVDIAFGQGGVNTKDQLAAMSIIKAYTMSKTSEQNITVTKDRGMAVRLPPKQEDPALKIMKGGKD